jgi:hypothetical protein
MRCSVILAMKPGGLARLNEVGLDPRVLGRLWSPARVRFAILYFLLPDNFAVFGSLHPKVDDSSPLIGWTTVSRESGGRKLAPIACVA